MEMLYYLTKAITDHFFNVTLLCLNIFSIFATVTGNLGKISRFAWTMPKFDKLISLLTVVDTFASMAGNGVIVHSIFQNGGNEEGINDLVAFIITTTGILTVSMLLIVVIFCWFSVKDSKLASIERTNINKVTIFCFIIATYCLFVLKAGYYFLDFDWLVCLISFGFCILNAILSQILSHLREFDTDLNLWHQHRTDELVSKVVQFAISWTPFLIISKTTSVLKLYKLCFFNEGLFRLSATWIFCKGVIDIIQGQLMT